jgi:hypothetical protein
MDVFSILEREVIRHARGLLDGSLPPFCLLRMAVSRDHRLEYAASASIADDTAAIEVVGSRHPEGGSRVPEVWIAVDEAGQVVLVDGGLRLDGASTFKLLKFLIARFEEDQRSQNPPDGTGSPLPEPSRTNSASGSRRCGSGSSASESSSSIGTPTTTRSPRTR